MRTKVARLALLIAIPALGAGALTWALVPKGGDGDAKRSTSAAAEVSDKNAVQKALELARDPTGSRRVIDSYVDWAGDPGSTEARKLLLNALFREPDVGKKLSAVLEAVESDSTPPEDDPLWAHLVESLANVWQGDVVNPGLDLMWAEERPRAKRALISSFAHLAASDRASELNPAQTQTLTESFIDLSSKLPQSQKAEVEQALRKIAGNDVADLAFGNGMDPNHELESHKQYKKAIEEAKELAKAPEGTAPADKPPSDEYVEE